MRSERLQAAGDLVDERAERPVARRTEHVAGDAEPAAATAAARGLDQGHLAELGVVGQDLRDGLGGRDVAHPLAFDAALAGAEQRHEDAGNLRELIEQLGA